MFYANLPIFIVYMATFLVKLVTSSSKAVSNRQLICRQFQNKTAIFYGLKFSSFSFFCGFNDMVVASSSCDLICINSLVGVTRCWRQTIVLHSLPYIKQLCPSPPTKIHKFDESSCLQTLYCYSLDKELHPQHLFCRIHVNLCLLIIFLFY